MPLGGSTPTLSKIRHHWCLCHWHQCAVLRTLHQVRRWANASRVLNTPATSVLQMRLVVLGPTAKVSPFWLDLSVAWLSCCSELKTVWRSCRSLRTSARPVPSKVRATQTRLLFYWGLYEFLGHRCRGQGRLFVLKRKHIFWACNKIYVIASVLRLVWRAIHGTQGPC